MNLFSAILLGLVSVFALITTVGAIGNIPYFFEREPMASLDKQLGRMVARMILGVVGGIVLIFTVLLLVVVYSIL
ncbi:MAG: hypothetical protein AAF824_14745 [Bacteroidota bacterium]